jgi:hypothetical protein
VEFVIRLRNGRATPMAILVEPWGDQHVIAPGKTVQVVATGPVATPSLEIEHADDRIVVYGWSGSRVAVIPDEGAA